MEQEMFSKSEKWEVKRILSHPDVYYYTALRPIGQV